MQLVKYQKKLLLAVLAVFVTIGILDYIIHSMILMNIYSETKELWRPEGEMKMSVMYISNIISVFFFVFIYTKMVNPKNMKNAIMFGLFWGIAAGSSMGYGTYSVMPLPYSLAAGWFWSTIIEMTIAGAVMGLIVKEEA